MKDSSIYHLENVQDILNYLFQQKKNKNPSFSLRSWAKRLGVNHPSYLSEVLNGKKRMTPTFLYRILPFLEIDEQERDYVECLCRIQNTDDPMEKEFFRRQASRIRPEMDKPTALNSDLIRKLTWYHGTIVQLFKVKHFKQDGKYLSLRMGGRVSPQTAELAVRELIQSGLFKTDKNGRVIGITDYDYPEFDPELPPPPPLIIARRDRVELAMSVFEQSKVRDFYWAGQFMSVRHKEIPAAREKLVEFFRNFHKTFERPSGADDVFRFDISFFKVTTS